MKDTIAAIATPVGRGAIGIIRISGKKSLDVLKRVWKSKHVPVEKFVTHQLYLGNIVDFSTEEKIDQVLAVYMKGPNTYTGENVVEINCHGSPQILKSILNQVLKSGARMAEPGEFTKRAFLNGKMDLVQAEAVAALIDSRSKEASRVAEIQLQGKLSIKINEIKSFLTVLLAKVEAIIDFPEEDTEFIENEEVEKEIKNLEKELARLIKTYDYGKVCREGIKIVIVGPPNAGKSSLLNAILGSERAIVHHIPGTTRDTIEEEVVIDGVACSIVDTAGIREAEEEVEEIGVRKSKEAMSIAEIVLFVLDGNKVVKPNEQFIEELEMVKHLFIVINKSDLVKNIEDKEIKNLFSGRKIFSVSAKEGSGINNLCSGIIKEMLKDKEEREDLVITSARHYEALNLARINIQEASGKIESSSEFIALHLRAALDKLGEITGEVTTEDILNQIFDNFCIGK